jgi:membrane AbrB-like protein
MSGTGSGGATSAWVTARTFALGIAAGWLFSVTGMPLPWLTGPIAVIAALAIGGVPVHIPDWSRPAIFIMLGLIIGSRVDSRMVADLARWPVSLGLLVLYVPVAIATMFAYFRIVARADPNTALVSSSPGSLAYVLAYAADSGADVRKVVVTQSVRLGILVLLLPLAITQTAPTPANAAAVPFDSLDQVWLFAVAAAGGALAAWKMSIPAAPMLGALVASALLHATGLNTAMPPDVAVNIAQVALGCQIGSRMLGTNRRELARVSLVGLGAVLVGLALTALFALTVDLLLGIEFAQGMLAFAPGAIEAMALMAISMDLDPAYVGAHHIARVMLMPLMIPLTARFLIPRPGKRAASGPE